MLHGRLLELRLEEDLEGEDELCGLLACQVDVAEFAFPQRASNVKIFQHPLLSLSV